MPDNDFLDVCWANKPENGKPLVIIFHGLEGSISSPYANGIMHALDLSGINSVFVHFRGCSGEHNRLDISYHSGKTDDIAFVVTMLRQRLPDSPLYALGYSLGGNALLKYLGESGEATPLSAAVAISVPYLLNRGADVLNTGFSRLYQWYLINSLKRKLRDKYRQRTAPVALDDLDTLSSFWLFDDRITAPIHGFTSATDYYEKSSSRQFLKSIRISTLLLHAKDDPFLPVDAIPEEHDLSECVTLELSKHGGHVGFVTGKNPFRPGFWLEQRIPAFIQQHLATG